MTQPARKLTIVQRLPAGVAMSRSRVINGRVVFCWRKLSKSIRAKVDDNSRPEFFDADFLDLVLEARTLDGKAQRRKP